MNGKAADMLRKAQMDGVPQIKGHYGSSLTTGVCGLGALGFREEISVRQTRALMKKYSLDGHAGHAVCPECGCGFSNQASVIAHMNDNHGFDFITIANKLHDPLQDVEA